MVSNVGLNLFVKRGGKSVLSYLCHTKPPKTPINFEGLKYVPVLEKDTVQLSRTSPLPKYNNFYYHVDHKSGEVFCLSPSCFPSNYLRKISTEDYNILPHYKLDKLWASHKGDGTFGVKDTVLKSLEDDDTCGRVLLDACCLDGVTAPGAFYYKLGFRHVLSYLNKECEQWIKLGGKYQDAPFITGPMYLPKENIVHCLKYGDEKNYFEYILPEYEEEIKRAIL